MKTDESNNLGQKSNQQIRNIDERNVKTREYKLFWMSFAAILMACGTHFFKYPNSFVIGGVEGMSIITSMFVPFTRPQLTLFYNVVLLVIGFFVIGKKFTIRTGYVAILNSLTALLLDKIFPIHGSLTNNKMLELIFTLLMSSVGSAILFNLAASSGGTDIIAMIMKKYTSLEVGKSLLVVDSLFTIASIKIFGIEIGLFSILGLMMKGIFVDMIIGSMNTAKLFIIITSKTEEIGNFIKKDLNRSATIIDARGLYKGTNISVFLCVTSNFESAKFRAFIKRIDPFSFITILNTSSIIGKGWYSSDDSLDSGEWLAKRSDSGKILVGRWLKMRKFINIILISFLTFNLTFTSFASDDQPGKNGTDQKPGEKIIITERVAPVSKTDANAKDNTKKDEAKPEANKDPQKKDEDKPADNKKEDSAYKARREQPTTDKAKNPEMESMEKVVDDLVTKLDKNSNLSKALAEMQTSINTDKKASVKSKDLSKKTEAVLKDYNKKIQSATTDQQRKKLENEAANKIKSISENKDKSLGKDENPDEDIPEKKEKILLEVKPDKDSETYDDRSQILALNPENEGEEENDFFLENPIVIIALIFVIALVVAIGIVLRNKRKYKKNK